MRNKIWRWIIDIFVLVGLLLNLISALMHLPAALGPRGHDVSDGLR